MAEGYPIFYVSVQTVSIGFPQNLVLQGEEVWQEKLVATVLNVVYLFSCK